MHLYSEDQIKRIKTQLRKVNIYFDYVKLPGRETETDFFEYDDLSDEEMK